MNVNVNEGHKKTSDSLDSCNYRPLKGTQLGNWELNTGPQEEQQVLLTAELSFKLPIYQF